MANFFGSVKGARGEATRLGHSELQTVAASWKGAISVYLYELDGKTRYRVSQQPWHGQGVSRIVGEGIIGE